VDSRPGRRALSRAGLSLRVLVHGAGSIGCYVGATWAGAGFDVSFLGRERIAQEVAEHGMTVTDGEGRAVALDAGTLHFSTSPEVLAEADLIALCVKSTGTAAAAAEIARHARPGTTVISFQNGVSNVETLTEKLPGLDILRGMVPFNVVHLGDGRWHKSVRGALVAEDREITRALSERIGDRPGKLILSGDMTGLAWGKLLINLNNAVNALSGKTLLEQLGTRDYRRVVAASQREALAMLAAAGIAPAAIGPISPARLPLVFGLPDFLFRRLVLAKWKIDANGRSSMADDFAAGRPTEIDYLNGEVVRLAERLGRPAPVNRAVVALVREAEAGGRRHFEAKDLRARVPGA